MLTKRCDSTRMLNFKTNHNPVDVFLYFHLAICFSFSFAVDRNNNTNNSKILVKHQGTFYANFSTSDCLSPSRSVYLMNIIDLLYFPILIFATAATAMVPTMATAVNAHDIDNVNCLSKISQGISIFIKMCHWKLHLLKFESYLPLTLSTFVQQICVNCFTKENKMWKQSRKSKSLNQRKSVKHSY